jgi:hypothetical protein
MKTILLLITLLTIVSCGKPTERCVSATEKRMECNIEWLANNSPISVVPQWKKDQCIQSYPYNGCY